MAKLERTVHFVAPGQDLRHAVLIFTIGKAPLWIEMQVYLRFDEKGMEAARSPFQHKPRAILEGRSINWHSQRPLRHQREDEWWQSDCHYTGGRCYHDVGFIAAEGYTKILLEQGEKALFKALAKLRKESLPQ